MDLLIARHGVCYGNPMKLMSVLLRTVLALIGSSGLVVSAQEFTGTSAPDTIIGVRLPAFATNDIRYALSAEVGYLTTIA